jgi:pantoate--beta-alanine ligase
MLLFKKVKDLKKYIAAAKSSGKSVGFVPTMGALHAGHLSLIEKSSRACDLTVCSIFVNPTQFNDPKDFEKYPRNDNADINLLALSHCDVLFLPDTKEVYPSGLNLELNFDFGSLTDVMKGKFRKGHFDGMAKVVKRLLDIVSPDKLFMGQKDFQQFSIIQSLLTLIDEKIQIVMCETVREKDGLAMSSRNTRLSPTLRKMAHFIHQTLLQSKEMMATAAPSEIEKWAMSELLMPNFKPEYFEIVDGRTLQPVSDFSKHDFIVACVATWLGEVRLIDNIILKAPSKLF